jgi:hypothetical protein
MSEQFNEHLTNLWQQGGRELALAFLRRAINANCSLAEVLKALDFEGVRGHLADIRLNEAFATQPAAPAAAANVRTGSARVPSGKRRRSRRTADEMQAMRALLQKCLNDENGSMDTVQLVEALEAAGHDVDTIVVNTLLKALEQNGHIVNLGGKPKAWRAARKAE